MLICKEYVKIIKRNTEFASFGLSTNNLRTCQIHISGSWFTNTIFKYKELKTFYMI